MAASLALVLASGALVLVGASPASASEDDAGRCTSDVTKTFVVTDPSDPETPKGWPEPGDLDDPHTLREVAEAMKRWPGESANFEVIMDVGDATIELKQELAVDVSDFGCTLTWTSLDGRPEIVLPAQERLIVDSDEQLSSLLIEKLRFRGGSDFETPMESRATVTLRDVDFTGIHRIYGHSAERIHLDRVHTQSSPTEFMLLAEIEIAEGVYMRPQFVIESSVFDASPLLIDSDSVDSSVIDSTFSGVEDDSVFELKNNQMYDELPTLSVLGSVFERNSDAPLLIDGTGSITIADSRFSHNQGTVLEVDPEVPLIAALEISNSEFVDNESDRALLVVDGDYYGVRFASNTFARNSSDLLELRARPSRGAFVGTPPPGVNEGVLEFAANTFVDNRVNTDNTVSSEKWVESSGAQFVARDNLFQNTEFISESYDSVADIVVPYVTGEGVGIPKVLLERNTFVGSVTAERPAQFFQSYKIEGGEVTIVNNTMRYAAEPTVGLDSAATQQASHSRVSFVDLGEPEEGAIVRVAHNTFDGGDINIECVPDRDYSRDDFALTVQANAWVSPSAPIPESCDHVEDVLSVDNVSTASSKLLGIGEAAVVSREAMRLGSLADNGGVTSTMRPGEGSVLLGAATMAPPAYAAADQRGVPRPAGSGSDVGAVELVRGSVAFAEPKLTLGGGATMEVPVQLSTPARTLPVGATGNWETELPVTVVLEHSEGTAKNQTHYEWPVPAEVKFPVGSSHDAVVKLGVATKQWTHTKPEMFGMSVAIAGVDNGFTFDAARLEVNIAPFVSEPSNPDEVEVPEGPGTDPDPENKPDPDPENKPDPGAVTKPDADSGALAKSGAAGSVFWVWFAGLGAVLGAAAVGLGIKKRRGAAR